MKRLQDLFKSDEPKLSMYFTAGYPGLNDTRVVLKALQESGADCVEIGIPFSDSLVDGPTIQVSNKIALDNGMNLKLLFEQLENMRDEISIPIILMTSLNPILSYGFEDFCLKAKELGVDGLIIPDLPVDIYQKTYQPIVENSDLDFIFLITPQTTDARIELIDNLSHSFIYAVSSFAITGGAISHDGNVANYFYAS